MFTSDEELAVQARSRLGTWLREKYRIDRVLGIGGMGSVYGATHRNGREVAIKLLHREYSLRGDLRRWFLREAQAANAVNHPGVVAIIDDDEAEDGAAFLVMELLEGRSAEELWEAHGRKLSAKTVLAIASSLCAILAVAHAAGVIHRDLKPANLFVTRAGDLKVLDFGIARVRDEVGAHATRTGTVMGTPAYMAPEQAAGFIDEVGPLTDVWATGATMFTLLTGRSVHEGRSGQHVAVLAATTPAPSLSSVLVDALPELVALIDRALAFDKTQRWPSAAAFRAAISEVEERLSAKDVPVGSGLSETMLAVAGVQPMAKRSGTLQSVGNHVLGGTTGQPVSSSRVTEPDRRVGFWNRLVARRSVRGPDSAVSSDAPTRRFSNDRRTLIAVACSLSLLGLGALIARRSGSHADDEVRLSAPVSASGAPSAVVPATELPPAREEPPPAKGPSAMPEPSSSSSSPSSTSGRSSRGGARTRPAPVVVAPKSNCDPPFTVQDGILVHKAGCQ